MCIRDRNLVVAFCTLVSAGGSTIASIRLGQKDMKGATEILSHTLMLCITNSFFFGILSFIFLDDILTFFGASPDTLPYARSFMQVILLGTPITYTMIGLNNVMRATGYPKKAMLTSMVTVVANIILAPIFIFHFEWGMRGAATATVISQLIGMVWVVSHFCKKDSCLLYTSRKGLVGNTYCGRASIPKRWIKPEDSCPAKGVFGRQNMMEQRTMVFHLRVLFLIVPSLLVSRSCLLYTSRCV